MCPATGGRSHQIPNPETSQFLLSFGNYPFYTNKSSGSFPFVERNHLLAAKRGPGMIAIHGCVQSRNNVFLIATNRGINRGISKIRDSRSTEACPRRHFLNSLHRSALRILPTRTSNPESSRGHQQCLKRIATHALLAILCFQKA